MPTTEAYRLLVDVNNHLVDASNALLAYGRAQQTVCPIAPIRFQLKLLRLAMDEELDALKHGVTADAH